MIPSRFVDEADMLAADDDWTPWAEVARLEASGDAHTAAAVALEDLTIRGRVLIADQYAGIADVLRDAAACPDPWVGPDPTLDRAWRDPRDRTRGRRTRRAPRHRGARRGRGPRGAARDVGDDDPHPRRAR